jgi:hypothetical protein
MALESPSIGGVGEAELLKNVKSNNSRKFQLRN